MNIIIATCEDEYCEEREEYGKTEIFIENGWRICTKCKMIFCPEHASQMNTPDRYPVCPNCSTEDPCWFAAPDSSEHIWIDAKTNPSFAYNDGFECISCGLKANYGSHPWNPKEVEYELQLEVELETGQILGADLACPKCNSIDVKFPLCNNCGYKSDKIEGVI